MHGLKVQRRREAWPEAVAARQAYDDPYNGGGHSLSLPDVYDTQETGSSTFLTGPITIFVTEIVYQQPSTNSIPAASTTLATDEPEETSAYSSTPSRSITFPHRSSTGEQPSNTGIAEPVSGASSRGPGRMTSGAIIGVVIGIILLLAGIIYFFARRRYVAKRIRLRKQWAHSNGIKSRSTSESKLVEGGNTPLHKVSGLPSSPRHLQSGTRQGSPTMSASRGDSGPLISFMAIPQPPASYGSESPVTSRYRPDVIPLSTSLSKPKPASPTKVKIAAPIYGPPSSTLSAPSTATVVSTFITTLPDELGISVGETVTVLSEFDDGWGMCSNAQGERGVIPLECLDRGLPMAPNDNLNRAFGGNLKRVSSLRPQGYGKRGF